MNHMLSAFYTRPLIIYLVLALVAISAAAGPAEDHGGRPLTG